MIKNEKELYYNLESQRSTLAFISNIAYSLYLITCIIAERNVIGRICLFCFIACGMLCCLKIKFRVFNPYFILETLFIGYCIFQNIWGITVNVSAAKEMISTLFICLLFNISLYGYVVCAGGINQILRNTLNCINVGVVLHFALNIKTVMTGKIGVEGMNIGGIKFGTANPVGIGWLLCGAAVLSMILYWEKNRKKAIKYLIIYTIFILICGTRKVLITIPLLFAYTLIIENPNKKLISKLLRTCVLSIVLLFIMYQACIHVQFLYNIIGRRFETLVYYINTGEIVDGSLNMRLILLDKAKVAFSEKPITGWGLDAFANVIFNGGYYCHNNYYEILVSGGFVGAFIFYSKYLYLFVRLSTQKKCFNSKGRFVINLFLFLFFIYAILEFWQVTYFTRRSMMFFVMMIAFVRVALYDSAYIESDFE